MDVLVYEYFELMQVESFSSASSHIPIEEGS